MSCKRDILSTMCLLCSCLFLTWGKPQKKLEGLRHSAENFRKKLGQYCRLKIELLKGLAECAFNSLKSLSALFTNHFDILKEFPYTFEGIFLTLKHFWFIIEESCFLKRYYFWSARYSICGVSFEIKKIEEQ